MIGIFLTTFNFLPKTRLCLASLARASSRPYRLVIVDNASTDGTKAFVRSLGIDFIGNAGSVSLTKALNQGIRHLLADPGVRAVTWIHNDMLFFRGWLDGLWDVAQRPEVGKLAPYNVCGDPGQYNDAWADRFMAEHRDLLVPGNNCPWLMRREVVERVGLFDERYIKCGGCEDWDYNNRVVDRGLFVGTTGAGVVWHEGMGTRAHIDQQDACLHNAGVYAEKWGNRPWV